jgi:hypothetical protein
MSNIYGRQVILPLTNKSGGGVVAGDVVITDSTNNDAFTTTTSAGYTGVIGVAAETIANNATGRVLLAGYAALVNVNASVTRGHYGKTHTVAKQAADASARTAGVFCQFLTGGTTPDAHVFGITDASTGGAGSPGTPAVTLSTTNSTGAAVTLLATDATIAVFDATVPAALGTAAAGSAGFAARRDHVHPNTAPGAILAAISVTTGDVTTNSASLADADATNFKVTFTAPASGNVLVMAQASMAPSSGGSSASALAAWGLRESTTNVAGPVSVARAGVAPSSNVTRVVTQYFYLTGVSAGSHTYKMAHQVDSSATTIIFGSGTTPFVMVVWAA